MIDLPAKTTMLLILEAVLTGLLSGLAFIILRPVVIQDYLVMCIVGAIAVKALIVFVLWDLVLNSLEEAVILKRLREVTRVS